MNRLLLTLALLTAPLHAAQYAVIATVNDYPGSANDLKGCNADGDAMAQILTSRFGFPAANILRLKDGEVTTPALRRAIAEHLVGKAQPGDAAVLFYSGHGTQVPDMDGDERDDADEALCTVDMTATSPDSWLSDDVLRSDFSKLKTNRLTIILECCHSGTGTRGVESDAAEGGKYLDLGFGRPQDIYRNLSISTAMKAPTTNTQHILLAACASHELAREDGVKGGYFRLALEKALEERGDTVPLEKLYEPIRSDITQRMSRTPNPKKQTPQIEGDARLSLKDLLGASAPANTPLAQPPAPQPPVVLANAATLAGDVGITLTTDKADYVVGERMTVTLKLAKDAHLRLYYTDGEQKSFLIFPNKFHPSDEVKAGEEIKLPSAGAGFAFEMTHPQDRGPAPVSEVLTAVASTTGFSDTRSLQWGAFNFIECTGQRYHEMVTRGIDIKAELKPGRATTIYRVRPKLP